VISGPHGAQGRCGTEGRRAAAAHALALTGFVIFMQCPLSVCLTYPVACEAEAGGLVSKHSLSLFPTEPAETHVTDCITF